MLGPIDSYFLKQEEPVKSCLLSLREHILALNKGLMETLKYGMPCYCYHGKVFCYLWIHKKYRKPYILIVDGDKIDHPDLLQEKRSRMKILLIDPEKDLPVKKIDLILKKALALGKLKK